MNDEKGLPYESGDFQEEALTAQARVLGDLEDVETWAREVYETVRGFRSSLTRYFDDAEEDRG